MLKRMTALFLAALLCAAAPLTMAEGGASPLDWLQKHISAAQTMAEGEVFTARDATLNKYTGTIAVRDEDSRYYRIINAAGEELLPAERYTSAYARNYGFFEVEVESEDGIHDEGLLDGQGRLLVPAEYADVNVISDRWQAGIKLTPSTAEDKDYTFSNWSTGEKLFFRIDTVDFYFDGQKAGTLDRAAYGGGSCTAYGAYVCVSNAARERVFYNSRMEPSPRKAEYSGEYEEAYQKGVTTVYHQGSGQVAFAPGCTLQAADVERAYTYDKGQILDLQGNVVCKTAQEYDSVRDFQDGLAFARLNRKQGLIDLTGKEIIPPVYDELGNYEDHPLRFGYISAVQDGKLGFLDANGQVTCPFVYSKDVAKNRGTFATVQNLDGTTIVLSAAVGELPEHYAEVNFPSYSDSRAFVAVNGEKQKCVVDIYGNTLLPYGACSSIDLTEDGTVCLVSWGQRQYSLYTFEIKPGEGTAAPAAQEPAAPAEAWTCENGHENNTGKFCPQCGAARPAQQALTQCPTCQQALDPVHVPNFCPNCGTALK